MKQQQEDVGSENDKDETKRQSQRVLDHQRDKKIKEISNMTFGRGRLIGL